MNKQTSDELSEIKLLILELSQQFNRKFEDQARTIRHQRDQLESQQLQLHNQSSIIEELAWQIRDLRDSVRKCSEKISNVQSTHHVNSPESYLKLNIPEANGIRQSSNSAGRKWFLSHSPSAPSSQLLRPISDVAFDFHFHLNMAHCENVIECNQG